MRSTRAAEFILQEDGQMGWFEVDGHIDTFVVSKEAAMAYVREAGACGTYFPKEEQDKLANQVYKALRMPNYENQVSEKLRALVKEMNKSYDEIKIFFAKTKQTQKTSA